MKRYSIPCIVAFFAVILFFSVGTIILPDRNFSDNENRELQTIPDITVSGVLSGDTEKEFEDYLSDQIILHDTLVSLRSKLLLIAGKKDIGGAYIGSDGYYFEKLTDSEVDEERIGNNARFLNIFFDKIKTELPDVNISYMIVPTSGLINSDKLPKNATLFSQNEYINKIHSIVKRAKCIDVRDTLLFHKDEYLYYKTDHHWTERGAFYAYRELCRSNGVVVPSIGDYNISTLTESFRGTLYSKVLDPDSSYDTIEKFDSKNNLGAVTVTADGKTNDSIYFTDELAQKDKYKVFMGGNYGICEIKGEIKNGKVLLLVKDSFANGFIPFLTKDYEKICVIDPRYYSGNAVQYAVKAGVTNVLALYNISNFVSDKNIAKLSLAK